MLHNGYLGVGRCDHLKKHFQVLKCTCSSESFEYLYVVLLTFSIVKKHQFLAVIKPRVCAASIVSIHWVILSALWRITQQLNPSALGRFPLSPDIWMDHTIISPALKPYAQWLFCLQTSLTGKISNHHGESRCFSFPAFLFFPFFSPQSTDTDACVQGQYWFLNHLTRAE